MAALLQLEENVAPLPDVWEVVYKAALALAKAAAVDEMLGNVSASLQSYAKVQYSRTEMIRHTTAHQLSFQQLQFQAVESETRAVLTARQNTSIFFGKP